MNSKGLHEIPVARWFSSLKSEKAREVQKKTLKIKLSSIDEHNQNDGQNCFCKEILSKKSTSAFRLQIVCLGCPNQYCSRDSKCHSEKIPVSPAHPNFKLSSYLSFLVYNCDRGRRQQRPVPVPLQTDQLCNICSFLVLTASVPYRESD